MVSATQHIPVKYHDAIKRLEHYLEMPWVAHDTPRQVTDPLVWTHPFFSYKGTKTLTHEHLENPARSQTFIAEQLALEETADEEDFVHLSTQYATYQQLTELELFSVAVKKPRHILFGVGIDADALLSFDPASYQVSQSHFTHLVHLRKQFGAKGTNAFFLTTTSSGFLSGNSGHFRPAISIVGDELSVGQYQHQHMRELFKRNKFVELTGSYGDVCMTDTCSDLRHLTDTISIKAQSCVFTGFPLCFDLRQEHDTFARQHPQSAWMHMYHTLGAQLQRENAQKTMWRHLDNPLYPTPSANGRARIIIDYDSQPATTQLELPINS